MTSGYASGIAPAFDVLGGKWKAAILWELRDGPRRFAQVRRAIDGVSEKMLIQQLRELERDDLVSRRVFPEVQPRVEYDLTDWGRRANVAMASIADWGEAYAKDHGRYPDATPPS